jgi:hypothetical protein
VIASCQDVNNESDVAATEQPAVDTVPKGRADSLRGIDTMTGKPDTMISGMAQPRTAQYIDLRTGQPVELYYDPKGRRTYSTVTNEPVDWYVNTTTGDTIYGRGRYVVNNYIIRTTEGMYKLDESKVKMDKDDWKIKEGDKKFKMDKGEMKIKGEDKKMKDKMKKDDMKMKSDDKETKIKND